MVVLSFGVQLFSPLVQVIHAQATTHEEDTQQILDSAESIAASMELVSLPEYQSPAIDKLVVNLTNAHIQGYVNERTDIEFSVNHKIGDIKIYLPEEVAVDQENLSNDLAVFETGNKGEWLLSGDYKRDSFSVPLLVNKAGVFSVSIEHQVEVQLEIHEKKASHIIEKVPHGDQNEMDIDEEADIEQAIDLAQNTESRNLSGIPIKEFELTGTIDNDADFHLIPEGTVPLRVSDETEIYYNGVLQTGSFNILSSQFATGEIVITYLGQYKGQAIEVVLNDFVDLNNISSIQLILERGNILVQGTGGELNTKRGFSLNQVVRTMDTKETIETPVIQGVVPYLRVGTNLRIEQSSLHSVFLLDSYDGNATVTSDDKDFVFDLGTPITVVFAPSRALNLILDSTAHLEMTYTDQNNAIGLFGCPGDDQFPVHDIELEANPTYGGNPTADSSQLWRGVTTGIRANPSPGYTFSSWEIVSGTGSSITDVQAEETTFTMGSENTVIRAVYEESPRSLTLEASSAAGGTPRAEVTDISPEGTTTISANLNLGYTFSRWEIVSGAGSSIANVHAANTTFTMGTENTTIRAVYLKESQVMMTSNIGVNARPLIENASGTFLSEAIVLEGDTRQIRSGLVSSGYTFIRWEIVSGEGGHITNIYSSSTTFTMGSSDTVLRAVFERIPSFRLTLETNLPEAGNPTANESMITEGSTTIIRPNVNPGYTFSHWELVSGIGATITNVTEESATFRMGTSDATVRAIYERKAGGNVEVNYIDTHQQKIEDSIILSGLMNDEYHTEAKEIEGYILLESPDNASGLFKEEAQVVNYIYDKDQVEPKDPLNPEIEVDPENRPNLSENQGLLSIDFASQFHFGERIISVNEKTFYAQPQQLLDGTETSVRPNYIQISDRRAVKDRGGWVLSVTQEEQFRSTSGHELTGAFLSFQNQQLASATENEEPTMTNADRIELHPGQKQRLLEANNENGTGTWIYRFGNQDTADRSIALNVPSDTNTMATRYESKLLWELSAVPSN